MVLDPLLTIEDVWQLLPIVLQVCASEAHSKAVQLLHYVSSFVYEQHIGRKQGTWNIVLPHTVDTWLTSDCSGVIICMTLVVCLAYLVVFIQEVLLRKATGLDVACRQQLLKFVKDLLTA